MRLLIRVLVLVLVLGVIAASAGAYVGVIQVPVLSAAFGMDKPADLGADKPDVAAYEAFTARYGIVHTSPDGNYTFASKRTFAGSYALDAMVPESVILATRSFRGSAPSFHDVTIRFHDGSAEAAAFVDLSPYGFPLSGPVRASFRVERTGPRSVHVSVDSLQFGRIGVPGDILARAQDGVNTYLAGRLAAIDGLDIEELTFVDHGVRFKGTLPTSYGADPPKTGDLP